MVEGHAAPTRPPISGFTCAVGVFHLCPQRSTRFDGGPEPSVGLGKDQSRSVFAKTRPCFGPARSRPKRFLCGSIGRCAPKFFSGGFHLRLRRFLRGRPAPGTSCCLCGAPHRARAVFPQPGILKKNDVVGYRKKPTIGLVVPSAPAWFPTAPRRSICRLDLPLFPSTMSGMRGRSSARRYRRVFRPEEPLLSAGRGFLPRRRSRQAFPVSARLACGGYRMPFRQILNGIAARVFFESPAPARFLRGLAARPVRDLPFAPLQGSRAVERMFPVVPLGFPRAAARPIEGAARHRDRPSLLNVTRTVLEIGHELIFPPNGHVARPPTAISLASRRAE